MPVLAPFDAASVAPDLCEPWSPSPPPVAPAAFVQPRLAVDLAVRRVFLVFQELVTPIEIFEARLTGDFPTILAPPAYDTAGLEAEPGFELSFDDAVSLGRKLQGEGFFADEDDIDLNY